MLPLQWWIQDFPDWGGINHPKVFGGHQPNIWSNFPKNCMKMKKFGPGVDRLERGARVGPPQDRSRILCRRGCQPTGGAGEVSIYKFSKFSEKLHQIGKISRGFRFPLGRGCQLYRGVPTYDFSKFSQNCMKLKEFGPQGGGRPKFYYVDPPLLLILC